MTEHDVRALIRQIDRGEVSAERWNHEAHVAMAVWYLTYLPRRQALRVIRGRILATNRALFGTAGRRRYHETVTLFLARGLGAFLDALPEVAGFEVRVSRALAAFADHKDLVRRYYTATAIESFAAWARFVEPDRRPMRAWLSECAERATETECASPALAAAS